MVLNSYSVLLPSLGRVSSPRSGVWRPIITTHDAFTRRPWAFPAYTRDGPHGTPNTEGQGARVRPNMKLGQRDRLLPSPLFDYFATLAALDMSLLVYFLPLISLCGHDGITYTLKLSVYQLSM